MIIAKYLIIIHYRIDCITYSTVNQISHKLQDENRFIDFSRLPYVTIENWVSKNLSHMLTLRENNDTNMLVIPSLSRQPRLVVMESDWLMKLSLPCSKRGVFIGILISISSFKIFYHIFLR